MTAPDDTQQSPRPDLRLVPPLPISRADVVREDVPAFVVGLCLAAIGGAFAASLVLGVVVAAGFAVLSFGRRVTA